MTGGVAYSRLEQAAQSALTQATQIAYERLKSPAFWGSVSALGARRGLGSGSRSGIHTGQLYRATQMLATVASQGVLYAGIGDLNVLDALETPEFFVNGRAIKRTRGGTAGYWRYVEYGVKPNPAYRYLPVAISPWSRARSLTSTTKGKGLSLAGNARLQGWTRQAGVDQRGRGSFIVPIAHSPQFEVASRQGLTRLPFRDKTGTGATSRFKQNVSVGFMVPTRGSTAGHPGAPATYMFLRTYRLLRARLDSLLGGNLREYAALLGRDATKMLQLKV